MRITHGGGNVGMAQQFLNRPQVHPLADPLRGAIPPHVVKPDPGQPRPYLSPITDPGAEVEVAFGRVTDGHVTVTVVCLVGLQGTQAFLEIVLEPTQIKPSCSSAAIRSADSVFPLYSVRRLPAQRPSLKPSTLESWGTLQ